MSWESLGIKVKIIEPGGVATDFGGRSLTFASREELTTYDETAGRFRVNLKKSDLIQSSTAEFLAEGIYNAASDASSQLRYLVGPDAQQIASTRKQLESEKFITGMKEKLLG